ncbi:DUF2017 family protein [Verrucomicrobiota bacterium sgz303538]
MEIRRTDEQTIVIEDLDQFLAELLDQISTCADPGDSESVHDRLYSSPTHGKEPEFDEEWKQYVEPELREHFQSALEVVREDLANSYSGESASLQTLVVPVKHIESWIHALNQARLALGARYDVTEEDMEKIPLGMGERELAIFQIHFYGYLQECFLHELEG